MSWSDPWDGLRDFGFRVWGFGVRVYVYRGLCNGEPNGQANGKGNGYGMDILGVRGVYGNTVSMDILVSFEDIDLGLRV